MRLETILVKPQNFPEYNSLSKASALKVSTALRKFVARLLKR